MSSPLVSIVVPVYNVEQYLSRCVRSLQAQTLKEIEIILVDDGSPDRCGLLCDAFSREDSRIVVVHKENGGLPSARNAGIEVATGEYIGFVDSDDWVTDTMFEELYRSAEAVNADLAICDYTIVSNTCKVIPAMEKPSDHIGDMLLCGIKPLACNKIFRRGLELHFYEELKFAEDRPTVIPFLTNSRRVAYVPKPLYYYFQRSGSIADTYTSSVAFPYDIQSMRLTIQDSAPQYSRQVAKYFMDVIKWTIKCRPACKADMIEFLQEIYPLLRQNRYATQDAKAIDVFLVQETIPKRLVYFDCKSEVAPSKQVSACRESWDRYGVGMEAVALDNRNYDIAELPACVRYAFVHGDTRFVSGYFRLRYIYEHGGIAVDDVVRLNSPLGELRAGGAFFGFINGQEISDHIFGSVAGSKILEDILATYEMESILNDDSDWSLGERIYTVLKQFGMDENRGGISQKLKEDVKVYGYEYLSYKVNSKVSIAQIFDETVALAEEKGLVLMDASMAEALSKGSLKENKNTKDLQYRVQVLQREVNRLKNSRSWRITRPLRRLFNFFRRTKYSEKEVL